MRLTHATGTHTVVADRYQVRFVDGAPDALLSDRRGRVWSRLCLLADVDRVDVADESFDVGDARITEERVGGQDVVDVVLTAGSPAWRHKSIRLRCFADRLELQVRVEGAATSGCWADGRSWAGGRADVPLLDRLRLGVRPDTDGAGPGGPSRLRRGRPRHRGGRLARTAARRLLAAAVPRPRPRAGAARHGRARG